MTDGVFRLVTESMKRECAIAEDFWRDLLKELEEKIAKWK